MILYDDRGVNAVYDISTELTSRAMAGLDIYDEITKLEEYYLYSSELAILQKHSKDIVCSCILFSYFLLMVVRSRRPGVCSRQQAPNRSLPTQIAILMSPS